MVRSRSDEIRQRIAKRRKDKEKIRNTQGLDFTGIQNGNENESRSPSLNLKANGAENSSLHLLSNDKGKTSINQTSFQGLNDTTKIDTNQNGNHSQTEDPKPEVHHSTKQKPDENQTSGAAHNKEHRENGSTNHTLNPPLYQQPEHILPLPDEDDDNGFNQFITYEGGGKEEVVHPLFRKEVFFFKVLASACLFLVIAIMFRSNSAALDPAKSMVKKAMDTEFQFASVTDWYENKFGKPLALLPVSDKKATQNTSRQYAVPASGRILENFQKNGQGIMIETNKGTRVEAMNEGLVIFSGIKEGIGKTVIIQHADKTESWYGNLDAINVNLYESIKKGNEVGTVSGGLGKDKSMGEFYFAIKKGDHFIDPIQVIRFE